MGDGDERGQQQGIIMVLIIFFFILSMCIIVAQTTLFQFIPDWLGRPDFLFILVVFAAYRFNWVHGLFFVFTAGWMLDVVSGIQLGIYPLQNIVVFSILKIITENSPLKEATYQVPLVGLGYFLIQMGFFFFYSLLLPGTLPEWSWNRVLQETIILVVATIPVFVALNFFYDFFDRSRVIHKVIRKGRGNQFR